MSENRVKPMPTLFSSMGNPLEKEIRRTEFDSSRNERQDRCEV